MSGLDLNLLKVLEAVMLERNVTRAALGLAMSQPAVSNALQRARRLTGDQLFVKVVGGVAPTPRMQTIWPELVQALTTIRGLIDPSPLDPREASITFRLAVTDSLASQVVAPLTLALSKQAPKARVSFATHTNSTSLHALERGVLDCAIGMFPSLPRTLRAQALHATEYVCVMRRGHPIAARLTLERFVAASHVLVTPSGQEQGSVDSWLSLVGHSRSVKAVVNRFADALRIVGGSDLITCVPSDYMESAQRGHEEFVSVQLPFETERVLYKLVWHERLHGHRTHQWFRSLACTTCATRPALAYESPDQRIDPVR